MRTVAFIGNFEVPFSTESHHAYTWMQLGWNVIKLQENKTNGYEVANACKISDLLQWTHTHGWSFPGEKEMMSTIMHGSASQPKIPSFSYHLDKYFGIGSRENNYLDHPSFHLDYFFSTDGGNEEGWKQAGINHHWILPGVVEYGCKMGRSIDNIRVLFTGSVGYHSEYLFRPRMVEALKANYGESFQVRTGYREDALNDLYASATVCVGDHIFAGCPRYCSDRLFETIGRGGFIIYPETEGITETIPGLVTYKPQDIQDLIHKIDYFLDRDHEPERIERRNAAFEYVKQHGTYTNRLRQILEIMNLA